MSLDKTTEKPVNQKKKSLSNTEGKIVDIVFPLIHIDYNLTLDDLINKVFLQTI